MLVFTAWKQYDSTLHIRVAVNHNESFGATSLLACSILIILQVVNLIVLLSGGL